MGTRSGGVPDPTWFEKLVLVHQWRGLVFEALATLAYVPGRTRSIADLEPAPGREPEPPRPFPLAPTWRQAPFEVAGYEPPGHLTLAGYLGPVVVLVRYVLEEIAFGTIVKARVELQRPSSLPDGVLWVGVVLEIQAEVAASLERLKRALESQSDRPRR